MFRTLILFIAVALLVLVVQKLLRQHQLEKARKQKLPGAEDMVVCVECQVHLPMSEALQKQGLYFCSREHLKRHRFD